MAFLPFFLLTFENRYLHEPGQSSSTIVERYQHYYYKTKVTENS